MSGLIYVFTGNGKGKTSAALGTAVRGFSRGWSVQWVAWYKEPSWDVGEYHLPEFLRAEDQTRFQMHALGKGFYIPKPSRTVQSGDRNIKVAELTNHSVVIDDDTPDAHHEAAQQALQFVRTILTENPPQLLVLDEVCNAMSDGLVTWHDVRAVLETRGDTHVVLTGRAAPPKLVEYADLVSEILARKHPYDQGILAVPGLDF